MRARLANAATNLLLAPVARAVDRLGFGPQLMRAFQRQARTRVGWRDFGDYRPTGHDVIVCTYPKSGTNWMLQIVHQIATRGQGDFDHIHDVAPWPDAPGPPVAAALTDERVWRASPTGLRAVKTHLAWPDVPFTEAARYLHVVRDPKDVFVSSYFFVRDLVFGPLMPSVETWLTLFLSSDGFVPVPACSWAAYLDGYWRQRQRPNVAVLRYEEMVTDLRGATAGVADFLGVTLAEAELDAVVDRSGFAHMRAINDRFRPPAPPVPWSTGQVRMIRQGRSGAARQLLSAEQAERIDAHCAAELARRGCDFPYAQLYGRSSRDAFGAR